MDEENQKLEDERLLEIFREKQARLRSMPIANRDLEVDLATLDRVIGELEDRIKRRRE